MDLRFCFDNKKERSFTLIELLVVIAIIGLLSSVVLVSMQGIRAQARDSIRKQDLKQLETALLKYAAQNDAFPSEACFDGSIGSDNCSCSGTCNANLCTGVNWCATSQIWQKIVTGGIMARLPIDPTNSTTYHYWYEPCCDQDCGGGRTCVAKGCCEYSIGANRLETTGSGYTLWGRWE